ncbi:AAA family ATPase [Paenibacillus campi]|uniref:AAA family ATPase n=1 Tax=Paenibacillus campi TaxID=3106031 RepID=UPI002AFF6E38|nr:AAA family ATPase [Paenibacillus sp. SGZ-1014]
MKSTVMFLIGSAGSGKSTIGKYIARRYGCTYLDKDIVCNTFSGVLLEANGYAAYERDGCDYYRHVVMPLEYRTLLDIANDNVQLGQSVILDAPFLSYFAEPDYVKQLVQRYGWDSNDVHPLVVQINVKMDVLRKRIQERNLQRDQWKFAHWDEFVEGIRQNICLWDEVDRIEYDNSADQLDEEQLKQQLHVHFARYDSTPIQVD